ncbi:SCO family protein [Mesorhizobium sp. CA18]|uniref:SCO family protein n=1 Tax=unclassified Mesorhizobium TaxID=325217 RepID=UPI001CCEC2D5|nr:MULTISPECIES: SCO family protein [unclassified Mesorhizobium]MBZ9733469.1 SCO family protein [Mesorhizobium sp. CA9]MBZ9824134.1 SCO family protein [Mesorhizobium sp. CA18]MBZ9831380.1 SCO family protein [Mesorhizobium sp. CA2]MBZ9837544.1 SCO family protein [Mesorhizobium sp. CA3]MBZ9877172.1 SCO family protein [Mesorhizobium sp. Ca11]
MAALCLFIAGMAIAAERPSFDPKLGAQLSLERELVDTSGRKLTLGETLGGRPALVIFGYDKCPNLCGVTQQAVASDLKKTSLRPADYRALFISIDPEETSADAAEAQAEIASAAGPAGASAWRFLTGSDGAGAALANEAGITFDRRKSIDQFVHPIAVIALTPSGRISQVLPALTFTPRDLQLALVEASANKLGSIADHVFLFCAGFDSSKGQYTPVIWAALKVTSLATALGLAAIVLWQTRRRAR